MNKSKLIVIAAESKMLKGLCYKLCNGRDIYNDLFQEFLLKLCEKDEAFLIEKYNDIQFISYCSNTIKGMNSDRYRDNKRLSTKKPLVERCTDFCMDNFDIPDESYNFEIDLKFKRTQEFISQQPKIKREILFKSVVSTTREAASELGMNQRKLIYQNNLFKSEIKRNVI